MTVICEWSSYLSVRTTLGTLVVELWIAPTISPKNYPRPAVSQIGGAMWSLGAWQQIAKTSLWPGRSHL